MIAPPESNTERHPTQARARATPESMLADLLSRRRENSTMRPAKRPMIIALSLLLQEIRFEDRTADAGLVEPLKGMLGHGAAWGDVDGDGAPDLYVGGFADRPGAPVPNRLFLNRGGGRFEPAGRPSVEFPARTSGALFVDLDGDGRPELFVSNNARAQPRRAEEPQRSAQTRRSALFRLDGQDWTEVPLPAVPLSARNVGAFDADGDGRLDLLILEDRFTPSPRSVLLRNLGGLKFEDVTRAAGLPEDLYGLGLAVADLNDDGRPDFFVAHSNWLFVSDGAGRYRRTRPLEFTPLDGEDWPCGADLGDLDGDGRPDLVVTIHHAPARNRLLLNEGLRDGLPVFRDVTREAGLGDPVPVKCPHVEIQDFDNDGRPDLYMTAARVEGDAVSPLIYRNEGVHDGLPRFVPTWPVREANAYFPAGPSCDTDGDGRRDVLLVNWFEGNRTRLLRNVSAPRRWIDVQAPIGSRVRVGAAQAEVHVGFGYAGGQTPVRHFGLGEAASADVEVRLPDGRTIARRGVAADRVLRFPDEPQVRAIFFDDLPDRGRGTLWSSWGDGCVARDGTYYTAIGDHRGEDGTSRLYALNPKTLNLRLVVDVARDTGQGGHGKIHAPIFEAEDGALYFATYRGKSKGLESGSLLLKYDPAAGKIESLGTPLPGRWLPAAVFDAARGRLICHAVDAGAVAVLAARTGKPIFVGGAGTLDGKRAFLADGRGRAYFSRADGTLGFYDPTDNALHATKAALPAGGEALRAGAPRPAADGKLYGMTQSGRLFAFDPGREAIEDLGPNFGEGHYTAVLEMSPDGRRLYFVPGAHGSSGRVGTPVVRFDVATRRRDVVVSLFEQFRRDHAYTLGGSYNLKLNAREERLFITFNGAPHDPSARKPETFGKPCVVVVTLR
jgi:hypothetical protein